MHSGNNQVTLIGIHQMFGIHVLLWENPFSSRMTKISELSKLSMIHTNHSIRATAITEMDEGGIATTHIMRVLKAKLVYCYTFTP